MSSRNRRRKNKTAKKKPSRPQRPTAKATEKKPLNSDSVLENHFPQTAELSEEQALDLIDQLGDDEIEFPDSTPTPHVQANRGPTPDDQIPHDCVRITVAEEIDRRLSDSLRQFDELGVLYQELREEYEKQFSEREEEKRKVVNAIRKMQAKIDVAHAAGKAEAVKQLEAQILHAESEASTWKARCDELEFPETITLKKES